MSQDNFIYIDDQKIPFKKGQSVLEAALAHDIDIPHFCHHPDLPTGASCRTCLVKAIIPKTKLQHCPINQSTFQNNSQTELAKQGVLSFPRKRKTKLKGETPLQFKTQIDTSCTLKCTPGLKIKFHDKETDSLRRQNMELLFARHKQNCQRCQNGDPCPTAQKMIKWGLSDEVYQRRTIQDKPIPMVNAAELTHPNCINCNKCAEICQDIGIGYLNLDGEGANRHIVAETNPKVDCVYCGQCTAHCPTGAAHEVNNIADVKKALADPNKIVIAQMAPSVRVSIGEEFGAPVGTNLAPQMNTALRQLGFDKIFDVNMGADITTWVEAGELVERIKNQKGQDSAPLPMFTSCCPAWVKFVEFYFPELIPHLTTSRSPQIHSGGAYKTWWAEKEGIDPQNIVVVSIMPCTSKKYESRHEKMKIDGMWPVDWVLTSREMGTLLRNNGIDLPNLEGSEVDPAGKYSGAAAIYGASGGVMESALRTAAFMITGEDMGRLEYEEVRGMEGIKKANIKIGDMDLKVAVVATPKNARIILHELKKNPEAYHYVEFMACPGGCIGGGGQPLPNSKANTKERTKGLYSLDKSLKIRKAHHNPVMKEFWSWVETQPEERQGQILHTHYEKREKGT